MITRLRRAASYALFYSIYILGPLLYFPSNTVARFYSWLSEKPLYRSIQKKTERLYTACTGRHTTAKCWSLARLTKTGDVKVAKIEHLDLKPYDKKHPAKMARDILGNIVVLWCYKKRGADTFTLYAKDYSPEFGWSNAGLIASKVESFTGFQLAIDGIGNACAVWEQPMETVPTEDTTASNIWGNRFVKGKGWGTAVSLEPGTQLTDSRDPIVTCNKLGNATVVWHQNEYGHNSFWINRFSAATGWGTAEIFLPDTQGEAHSRATLDEEGNAIIIWLQRELSGNYTIWARHYNVETKWNEAVRISRKSENASFEVPQLVIDSRGNALAAWTSLGRYSKVTANYYTAGKGWGHATRINLLDPTSSAGEPEIGLNANGVFRVVWQQALHGSTNSRQWARYLE